MAENYNCRSGGARSAGTLNPNHIHTPGIFVQRVFKGDVFEKG